jgi:hypothetical protein
MVTRVLTPSQLEALETLARTLERKGLTEERDALLGVIGASAEPRELSVSEAAALARKCAQTIRNWIKAGRLPARADGTNHYYVPLDALLPMLGQRAPAGAAGAPRRREKSGSRAAVPPGLRRGTQPLGTRRSVAGLAPCGRGAAPEWSESTPASAPVQGLTGALAGSLTRL